MVSLSLIMGLLVYSKFKHFIADYPLQTTWMLGKFRPGWDFLPPLLAHVGVHGAFTLVLCLAVRPTMWWLALVDMAAHFVMDRVKAGPKYLGRFKALSAAEFQKQIMPHLSSLKKVKATGTNAGMSPLLYEVEDKLFGNKMFWISMGFDQMWHGLTDLFVVYMLMS